MRQHTSFQHQCNNQPFTVIDSYGCHVVYQRGGGIRDESFAPWLGTDGKILSLNHESALCHDSCSLGLVINTKPLPLKRARLLLLTLVLFCATIFRSSKGQQPRSVSLTWRIPSNYGEIKRKSSVWARVVGDRWFFRNASARKKKNKKYIVGGKEFSD